jgi:hypothetical protein
LILSSFFALTSMTPSLFFLISFLSTSYVIHFSFYFPSASSLFFFFNLGFRFFWFQVPTTSIMRYAFCCFPLIIPILLLCVFICTEYYLCVLCLQQNIGIYLFIFRKALVFFFWQKGRHWLRTFLFIFKI